MHFYSRPVFHGDFVQDSFKIVILGMKTTFTPNINSKYVWIIYAI